MKLPSPRKEQVTLPKELRKHLGIEGECLIRFVIPANGSVQLERPSYELEDLWRLADKYDKPRGVMSFEEMNEANAVRSGTMPFDKDGLGDSTKGCSKSEFLRDLAEPPVPGPNRE